MEAAMRSAEGTTDRATLYAARVRVRVLYFAAMRDLAGRTEEELALPDGVTTVGAFAAHLAHAMPGFAERRAHVRIARNESFAADEDAIREGDVLALIPPVAGG
jgi:molybdopterin converting factor subunit 1